MLQGSNGFKSKRVLIHTPYGRDGTMIRNELLGAGFSAKVCTSVDELCSLIEEGAGAALLGDEALVPAAILRLAGQLAAQPPWSDFPLLVMTSGGASNHASRYRLGLLEPLGNVALLERPLRPETLVSSLRAALRARQHQYQLSEHLSRIESSEEALRQSEARFRFLSELGEATRSVSKPEEVTAVVAQRLSDHLEGTRCAYATVEPDSGQVDFVRDDAAGIPCPNRTFHLSLLGSRAVSAMYGGRSLIIRDVGNELAHGEGQETFSSLGMQAVICVPLVKEGKLVAMMAVYQPVPRDWTEDEVELAEEVGERCWAYIERERLVVELAENNEALQRTNHDLMAANHELEEFAYVASHDLQEPLRMVNIYTQLILKRLNTADETLNQYAQLVRQGAGRMEELIRDVLSFSRTIHAESRDAVTADLAASLADAMAVLKSRIDENQAVVQAQRLPAVRGDTSQLALVFQNLIANSIKYRKADQTPEIHISAERHEGQWVVSVGDNGIGFEQRYAERIFGLFKRLHKEEYPGTGLGLAICQRIVERYGGRMWAVGKTGEGSTFYFSLPAVEA
jgi:signal transduction histidine kinase/DNA-binding response OmpR family regulator